MRHPEPHHRPGFVHHVDGLVGKGTVGYIAVGLLDAGLQGLGGVLHVVEVLVILAEVAQYIDGLGYVRGFHDDLQESPVECSVLLDDLGELVHGRGADALDLTACKRGLEHVGGIEAALCTAGTYDGVELVDEEYDVRIGFQILNDAFQAFLEITPIARSGHDRCYVQGNEPLASEGGRYVARGDLEGKALDDRGLAYAGLAYEHGIVLLAPAEDLDDAGYLGVTAHDGIQRPCLGGLGQVEAELLHAVLAGVYDFVSRAVDGLLELSFLLGCLLRPGIFHTLEQVLLLHVCEQDGVGDPAVLHEGLAVAAFHPADGQDEMRPVRLGVLEARGLEDGEVEQALGGAGEHDLVDVGVGDRSLPENMYVDELLHLLGVGAEAAERPAGVVVRMPEDTEHEMVGPDAVTPGAHGFLAGVTDDQVQFIRNFHFHA